MFIIALVSLGALAIAFFILLLQRTDGENDASFMFAVVGAVAALSNQVLSIITWAPN